MTLGQLLAPIAAAVNVALLGLAWRATQIEKRTGRAPWYLGAGIVVYGLGGASFLYASRKAQFTTPLEVLGVSLLAEVLGAAAMFGVFHAIYRKDRQPPAQRAFEIGGSLILLLILLGATLS